MIEGELIMPFCFPKVGMQLLKKYAQFLPDGMVVELGQIANEKCSEKQMKIFQYYRRGVKKWLFIFNS